MTRKSLNSGPFAFAKPSLMNKAERREKGPRARLSSVHRALRRTGKSHARKGFFKSRLSIITRPHAPRRCESKPLKGRGGFHGFFVLNRPPVSEPAERQQSETEPGGGASAITASSPQTLFIPAARRVKSKVSCSQTQRRFFAAVGHARPVAAAAALAVFSFGSGSADISHRCRGGGEPPRPAARRR